MDKGLNGLNSLSYMVLVCGLPGWVITGATGEKLANKKASGRATWHKNSGFEKR